jgi:O-antigen/teichoic acid export membrane protein
LASNDRSSLKKAMLFNLLLLVAGVIVLFILGSWILNLFNPEYLSGLTLLYILAISSIPFGVRTLYSNYLNILGLYKKVMFWNFVVLLITLFGTIYFLSSYGLIAVGVSWLLANIVGAVGVWVR